MDIQIRMGNLINLLLSYTALVVCVCMCVYVWSEGRNDVAVQMIVVSWGNLFLLRELTGKNGEQGAQQ